MKYKVSMVSLGCTKNLVDSEVMLGILQKNGCIITDNVEGSDIAIVNTCGFIKNSTKESVDKILELIELKKKNKIKILIVAGCLPQKYKKKELLDGFREVDAFLGTNNIPDINNIIKKLAFNKKLFIVDSFPGFLYNDTHPRYSLTPGHLVYVKIAEGCSNRCSYCLIPGLRGDYRSRKIFSVVKEIKKLTRTNKIAELNIIAQDTTYYGTDIYGSRKLAGLLKKIVKLKASRWIRLMYTHPAHLDDELIELIKREKSICRYIDLPIQHVNNDILRRMGRKVNRDKITGLVKKLRKEIPGIAIRTSLIAGFPGETEGQFRELLEFVKEIKFDRVGVFTYSREKGTRAYGYKGQVPERVKKTRYRALMLAQQKVSLEINRSFIGREMEALVDGVDKSRGILLCRTRRDAPEIDGYTLVKSGSGKPGSFIKVRITDANAYDLIGRKI